MRPGARDAARAAVEHLDVAELPVGPAPSTTAPGRIALKLDESWQLAPVAELAVAVHGTAAGKSMSRPVVPLESVIRTAEWTCSWPV